MKEGILIKMMKKYLYLIKISFLEKLAYPKAVWFDVIGTMISIIFYYYLWYFIFSKTESIAIYSPGEMIMYIIISRLLATQFGGGIDMMFSKWVYEGKIGIELLRPISLLKILIFRRIGEFLLFCIFKGLPIFIMVTLILDDIGIFSISKYIFFSISICFSLFIMFYFEVLVGLCSFYTMNSYGLRFTKNALLSILSGGIIPIFLLPNLLKKIFYFLPFVGMITVPVEILLGKHNLMQTGFYLMFQMFWIFVMCLIVKNLLKKTLEKVTIQGG